MLNWNKSVVMKWCINVHCSKSLFHKIQITTPRLFIMTKTQKLFCYLKRRKLGQYFLDSDKQLSTQFFSDKKKNPVFTFIFRITCLVSSSWATNYQGSLSIVSQMEISLVQWESQLSCKKFLKDFVYSISRMTAWEKNLTPSNMIWKKLRRSFMIYLFVDWWSLQPLKMLLPQWRSLYQKWQLRIQTDLSDHRNQLWKRWILPFFSILCTLKNDKKE